ncbi:ABC transporter substrate-binding protein [Thermobifida cellulosilytica]|uniref:ABC transporter substrate-binding protein n=1 Tax=Thermobifida cellulosilytica TaxID=144786 RepID=UPI0009FCE01F|nr:ABC transporter substrate-binding protein [Thermobifida cellulosilytica]
MDYTRGKWAPRTAAAVALITTLTLTGCGLSSSGDQEAATDDITLRVGMGVDVQSLDPPNFSLAADFTRLDLLYDRLIELGEDGSPQPSLATSWEQNSDTEWTFELREGVKFTDGTDFNAEAVKKSLERAAKSAQGSGYLGVIEEVEVVGDYEVKLHLSEPFSGLLNNLSVPVSGIVSPKAIDEDEEGLGSNPVGTGPYTLESWDPDELMVLKRNEDYWGEKPTVSTLEISIIPEASTRFSALQAGDVDVIENPPPSELDFMRESDALTELIEPKAQPVFLGFELEEIPDVDVRRAIAMAIDKEAIVEDVLEGVGDVANQGLVPPALVTQEDDPINIDYDPEEAKKLLKEAGVDEVTFDLVLPSSYYLKDEEVAQVIKSQLEEVGVTANLVVQESGTWFTSLLEHETQMYWLGWGMTAGDPADMLKRVFHSEAVNNMSGYSGADEEIEELAVLPVKSEEREATINEIQRRIVEEDVVVVPIYYSTNFYATSSSVEGFHTTRSTLWDLTEVTLKQ